MNLEALYKDPNFTGAFTGKEQFYQSVKQRFPNVTRAEVERELRKNDSYTLHKPTKRPRRYRRVFTKGINYLWQVGLD